MLTYVLLTGRQPFSSPKTDDPMVVMRRIVDDSFQARGASVQGCWTSALPPDALSHALLCCLGSHCAASWTGLAGSAALAAARPCAARSLDRKCSQSRLQIKFPPYVSPAAKDFVLRLLERKPTKRLGMLQVRVSSVHPGSTGRGQLHDRREHRPRR